MTSLLGDSVSLSLVLVDSGEDRVDNVSSDWSSEDSWQRQLGGGLLALSGHDGNLWSRHDEKSMEREKMGGKIFHEKYGGGAGEVRMVCAGESRRATRAQTKEEKRGENCIEDGAGVFI